MDAKGLNGCLLSTSLEVGSGTGNLAETIVNNSRLTLDYFGLAVDDLLIDLSASIADVMESSVVFAQGDAVRPQVLKESDLIVSDLPIGYYPDDAIAQRYQVASSEGHTYAHHLDVYKRQSLYCLFFARSVPSMAEAS